MLAQTPRAAAARAFLQFLQSDEARQVITRFGYVSFYEVAP